MGLSQRIEYSTHLPNRSKDHFKQILIFWGGCTAGLSSFILWINTFYFGLPISSVISFRPGDRWCPSENSGMGIHCFSDYYSPVAALHLVNPWAGVGYAYTPLASRVFWPFDQLSRIFDEPRVGLFVYLSIGIVCMLIPLLWAGKSTDGFTPIYAVVFGILGTPLLTAFDRGSMVMFTTPWLFLYVVSICRQNWNSVTLSTVVLISLKPQYLVLLLPFLIYRKWQFLNRSIRMSLLTTAIGFIAFTPNPLRVAQQWYSFATRYNAIEGNIEASLYNISIIESLKIPIDTLILPIVQAMWNITEFSSIVIGLIFGIVLILPLILFGTHVSMLGASIVSICTASLIIPQSNFYYQNFCIAIIAIILKDPHPPTHTKTGTGILDRQSDSGQLSTLSKYLLIAATVNSCFNLPISVQSFSFLSNEINVHSSISRVIVAPLWVFVICSINLDSFLNRRKERC
jgi:hypothetical protein